MPAAASKPACSVTTHSRKRWQHMFESVKCAAGTAAGLLHLAIDLRQQPRGAPLDLRVLLLRLLHKPPNVRAEVVNGDEALLEMRDVLVGESKSGRGCNGTAQDTNPAVECRLSARTVRK